MAHSIAYKIKKTREDKNFTQEWVAAQLDISTRQYAKIEHGETKLNLDRLEQLLRIFETTLEDFFVSDAMVINVQGSGKYSVNGGYIVQQNDIHAFLAAVREPYEKMIAERDERIKALEATILQLRPS